MHRFHATIALALAAACAHGSAGSKSGLRIPDRGAVLTKAKAQWGGQLEQIPSFVIDKGPLAYVPYSSYRAGDFEVNVYGDPAAPAAVEIGTYRPEVEAQRQVRALVEALLPSRGDAAEVASLDAAGEVRRRQGLTLEATPPTAPDAYGAWWISVYDEVALADARAEVSDTISEATSEEEEAKDAARKRPRTWPRASYTTSRRYAPATVNVSRVYTRSYARTGRVYVQIPLRH